MSWSLEGKKGDAISQYEISSNVEFTVGRKDCDLNLPDDRAVSRKHAILLVTPSVPAGRSSISIRDISSFGTYINKKKIDPNVPTSLQEGDKVIFGSKASTFSVIFTPLVVTTSCLDNTAKKEIKEIIRALGGTVVSEWTDNCLYLVMNYLSVTVKVVCALASQRSVVTTEYFKSLKTSIEKTSPGPNPKTFLPKLSESISISGTTFQPNIMRKSLFKGITFLFLNAIQWRKMKMSVELTGGQVMLCLRESDEVTDDKLVASDTVVMCAEASGEAAKRISHIQSVLESHSKRMIADAEIGQAVLSCSREVFCNPNTAAPNSLSQLHSQTLCTPSQSTMGTSPHTANSRSNRRRKIEVGDDEKDVEIVSSDIAENTSATILPFSSTENPDTKSLTRKRARIPSESKDTLTEQDNNRDEDDVEPTEKRLCLPKTSASESLDNASASETEVTATVLVPETMSQVTFIRPKPVTVIEDSDPEDIDSVPVTKSRRKSFQLKKETEDSLYMESERYGLTKHKTSVVTKDSEDLEEPSVTLGEIKTPVCVKQEPVDPDVNGLHQNREGFTLDLLTENEPQSRNKKRKMETTTTKPTNFTVKPGYLTTCLPMKNQQSRIVKQEEPEDPDLPKACVLTSFTNLVSRRPNPVIEPGTNGSSQAPEGFAYYKGVMVCNYKKFKKSSHSGSCSLPRIVGGADLVAYSTAPTKEIDEWMQLAHAQESQQNEDDRRAEELFNWEPKKKGKKTR